MAGDGGDGPNKITLLYAGIVGVLVLAYWYNTFQLDLSLSSVLVTGGYMWDSALAEQPAQQPVDFPHRHHVKDVGIECTFCHKTAEEEDFATIPNVDTCKTCHSVQQTNGSPREKNLRQNYVLKDKKIPWERIYDVPPHVYFSHERHTVSGDINCTTCHGPIPEQKHALSEPINPAYGRITMEFCLDCHEQKRDLPKYQNESYPPLDCLKCHR